MDLKELKELETKKLHDHLSSVRGQLMKLRFGVSNRQVKNVRQLRHLKREIAQSIGVLNQRRLANIETEPKQENEKN
jgi:ribosomal protein L29